MTGSVFLELWRTFSDGSLMWRIISHTYDVHGQPLQKLSKPGCGATIFVEHLTQIVSIAVSSGFIEAPDGFFGLL